jgi:hypothetical protein
MHVLLLGPQVLIWFTGAYLFGVGGFWISFVETLPTDSIAAACAARKPMQRAIGPHGMGNNEVSI